MSIGNTIRGTGTLSGPATIKLVSGTPSFAHSYNSVQDGTSNLLFMHFFPESNCVFFAWDDPSLIDFSAVPNGTVVTLSGITGANSSLNGYTMTSADSDGQTFLNAANFITAWVNLGNHIGFVYPAAPLLPGLILNWN